MGRGKLKLELIESERSRLTAFNQRKTCLLKKSRELSTLCEVKVCMIAYGPNATSPEIWPPNNDDEVKETIEEYKSQGIRDRKRRTVDVSHYFSERQKMAEDLLKKIRKENCEAKYPTWDKRYDGLPEQHLRNLANYLDGKIEAGKARIAALKGTTTVLSTTDHFTNNLLATSGSLGVTDISSSSYNRSIMDNNASSGLCYDTTNATQISDSELSVRSSGNELVQETSNDGQGEELGVVPFDANNSPPMTNPMMMINNNELSGNCFMYMPMNFGPIYYDPMMLESMAVSTVPMPMPMPMPTPTPTPTPMLTPTPMPIPYLYFAATSMPVQFMPPQCVPYTLVADDGSAQLHDSQLNQVSDFQMNN